ncbi:MAG: tripartite tricarboxylate transporter TctB family protein [Beijerinckiaceae bacterium]|nr:tripartite tricarboxylate transporter TctB family protein [Beijerinckiaceae bacterium]
MIRITHPQDFWSGLLFVAFGAFGAYLSREFTFGALTKMGPGFLPTVLSYSLMAVGAIVTARSFALRGGEIQPFSLKPQALIIGAIILFAMLIERVGLIPTVFAVILMTSYASSEFKLRDAILLGVGTSLICYVLFIYLLSVPMQPLMWNF